MPIYAYRCGSCGHAKEILQKSSDPLLTDCPACGAAQFAKQLTAASFHLKGSGWYATDFSGRKSSGGDAPAAADTTAAAADTPKKVAVNADTTSVGAASEA